jgi:type IV pilus assembly protein PilM
MAVGIDLGTRQIKVISGRKKGPLFALQRAAVIAVENAEDVEAAILAAIAELKPLLGKAPGARFGVSGREVIIRYTKVPPVPIWRLRLLMDFEVREMAEQAGEPLASDYNLVHVPGRDVDEDTVLVAVVKEHFLAQRFGAVSAAIGEPRSAVPSSLALFNAYVHSGDLHEGEYVFLVDIGDRNVELALQQDGELIFARNLAAGGGLLTDAIADTIGVSRDQAERIKAEYGNVTPKGEAKYASGREEKVANAIIGPTGQLSSMIQSSLAFARAQTGVRDLQASRILISGGGAALRGLPEYLAANFGCPVERFQPESGLDLRDLAPDERAAFETDPGRFSVALGLALADVNENAFAVDLVHEAARKKRRLLNRTLFLWLSAAAALVFLVFHFVKLSNQADELRTQARIEARKAAVKRSARQKYDRQVALIEDLNARSETLAQYTEPATALLEANRLLQEVATDAVWIESLTVSRKAIDKDPDDPKKGRETRTIVTATGEVVNVATRAQVVVQEMIRAIQERKPGTDVRLVSKSGGSGVGSRKLGFVIEIDFWAAPSGESEEAD